MKKTTDILKRKTIRITGLWVFLFVNLIVLFSFVSAKSLKSDQKVLNAFEMRMQGRVDQAKTLLDSIVKADPSCAMAWYELSRTLTHMYWRGEESRKAGEAVQRAFELEPENIIYAYAFANNCFLQAYIQMESGQEVGKDAVLKICQAFEKALELKPDYAGAMMNLVELYGYLPPEMGGDKEKAREYVKKLELTDMFYSVKAQTVLMPQETNWISYWNNYISEKGECTRSLKELGAAYFFTGDVANAEKCYKRIIELDPTQQVRLLDMARFHIMKVMQNRDLAQQELPLAAGYIDEFLNSTPEPVAPLKGWSHAWLSRISGLLENQTESDLHLKLAKEADPYFSMAFGIPGPYNAPNEVPNQFGSFFSPF